MEIWEDDHFRILMRLSWSTFAGLCVFYLHLWGCVAATHGRLRFGSAFIIGFKLSKFIMQIKIGNVINRVVTVKLSSKVIFEKF